MVVYAQPNNEGSYAARSQHDQARSTCDIFLSSAFRGMEDLRERIRALAPSRVWAVEHERPDLDTRLGVPPFVIVDALVAQVQVSSAFICVLSDRYGSSVFQDGESVSFLEIEIYKAALFHNNVHIFTKEPFNPPDTLSGLLEVIRTIRPGVVPDRAQSEQDILDSIARVIDHTPRRPGRRRVLPFRGLVGELARRRGSPQPDIEFLGNAFQPVSTVPDRDHVKTLLDGLHQSKGMEQRLTRMWVALRELSSAPHDQPQFAEYLPLWDAAIVAWTSAAAWYGLHGHLYAGRLAGVNSMLRIRERMDWAGAEHPASHYVQGAKGGRASEYYSMAKLMPTARQKEQYFTLALKDLGDALGSIEGDASGYLAIRGHIYLHLGRAPDALADFRDMLALRRQRGDEGGIGEALADLGLVTMNMGDLREARSLLRQGTEMLEHAGHHTFEIRARKRLALAHLRSFRPVLALREVSRAYDTAVEHQAYGQIGPLMEIAHDLACRIGVWRRD